MRSATAPFRSRTVRAVLSTLVLAAATVLFTPSAASATNWEPYTKDSTWHCATTYLNASRTAYGESCVVAAPDKVQGVTVVHNYSGSALSAGASTYLQGALGDYAFAFCPRVPLGDGHSHACFTPAVSPPCTFYLWTQSSVTAGSPLSWWNSPSRKMCA